MSGSAARPHRDTRASPTLRSARSGVQRAATPAGTGQVPGASSRPWANRRSARMPVTLVQCRNALGGDETRVPADEAGMGTDVDERPMRPEHAHDLPHHSRKVVHVGVRPDRDHAIEGRVVERQRLARRSMELRTVRSGSPQHRVRDVDAHDRPAEALQDRNGDPRAATEIEAAPVAGTEKALENVDLVLVQRRAKSLVPLDVGVVAGDRHQPSIVVPQTSRATVRPSPR